VSGNPFDQAHGLLGSLGRILDGLRSGVEIIGRRDYWEHQRQDTEQRYEPEVPIRAPRLFSLKAPPQQRSHRQEHPATIEKIFHSAKAVAMCTPGILTD
jgi:hypothetical protein